MLAMVRSWQLGLLWATTVDTSFGFGTSVFQPLRSNKQSNEYFNKYSNGYSNGYSGLGMIPEDTLAIPNGDTVQTNQNEVEAWLSASLPKLSASDVRQYSQRLVEEGFDSLDIIKLLQQEDLAFMKKGHQRALLQKLNEDPSSIPQTSKTQSKQVIRPTGAESTPKTQQRKHRRQYRRPENDYYYDITQNAFPELSSLMFPLLHRGERQEFAADLITKKNTKIPPPPLVLPRMSFYDQSDDFSSDDCNESNGYDSMDGLPKKQNGSINPMLESSPNMLQQQQMETKFTADLQEQQNNSLNPMPESSPNMLQQQQLETKFTADLQEKQNNSLNPMLESSPNMLQQQQMETKFTADLQEKQNNSLNPMLESSPSMLQQQQMETKFTADLQEKQNNSLNPIPESSPTRLMSQQLQTEFTTDLPEKKNINKIIFKENNNNSNNGVLYHNSNDRNSRSDINGKTNSNQSLMTNTPTPKKNPRKQRRKRIRAKELYYDITQNAFPERVMPPSSPYTILYTLDKMLEKKKSYTHITSRKIKLEGVLASIKELEERARLAAVANLLENDYDDDEENNNQGNVEINSGTSIASPIPPAAASISPKPNAKKNNSYFMTSSQLKHEQVLASIKELEERARLAAAAFEEEYDDDDDVDDNDNDDDDQIPGDSLTNKQPQEKTYPEIPRSASSSIRSPSSSSFPSPNSQTTKIDITTSRQVKHEQVLSSIKLLEQKAKAAAAAIAANPSLKKVFQKEDANYVDFTQPQFTSDLYHAYFSSETHLRSDRNSAKNGGVSKEQTNISPQQTRKERAVTNPPIRKWRNNKKFTYYDATEPQFSKDLYGKYFRCINSSTSPTSWRSMISSTKMREADTRTNLRTCTDLW